MGNTLHGSQLKQGLRMVLNLDHFFFLIYINNLSGDLVFTAKLFEDDKYLFSVVENMTKSVNDLLVHFNGKRNLTQVQLSRHKRLYLFENFEIPITHVSISILILSI